MKNIDFMFCASLFLLKFFDVWIFGSSSYEFLITISTVIMVRHHLFLAHQVENENLLAIANSLDEKFSTLSSQIEQIKNVD